MSKFSTRIDLPAESRNAMIAILNQQLANAIDLMTQVKHAHWNIKGPRFISLHLLFDTFYSQLSEQADTIAERATALGGFVHGTARMAVSASNLKEFPKETQMDLDVVAVLADRYASLAKTTRQAIGQAEEHKDTGTADLFTGVVRELDKSLWFLEAHLQGSQA